MRHKIAGNKLSRNQSLRKATVRDIAKATLIQQRIKTTLAKAKEARKTVDKLITLGKKGTLADKRRAFAILCDHKIVSNLFNKTSPRFQNRAGGYTRIIQLGNRRGDNAKLALLELTEIEEVVKTPPKPKTKKAAKSVAKDSAETKAGKEVASKEAVDFSKVSEGQGAKATSTSEITSKEKKAPVKEAKKSTPAQQSESTKEKPKKDAKKGGGLRNIFRRKAT